MKVRCAHLWILASLPAGPRPAAAAACSGSFTETGVEFQRWEREGLRVSVAM